MHKFFTQKYWYELFRFGIYTKGFIGVWEVISGLLFLFIKRSTLHKWHVWIIRNELLEHPNDKIMSLLSSLTQNFSHGTRVFAAMYIIIHGLLNIFLSVQLYREKHQAYLVAIGIISIFIPYQIYRIYIHHSIILTIITVFDFFFIQFIWHEYKRHRDKEALS